MRRILVVALVVFAMAFAIGVVSVEQPQAKGNCWYQCGCNGVALYCCRSGPIVNCKVVLFSPIECPQVADC